MRAELRTFARAMLISLILTPLLACATGMKMTAADVQTLETDEGLVLGSVRIEGGSDILGRTSWELVAEKAGGGMFSSNPDDAIQASRDGDEVVFLTRMPAGSYHFFKLVQPGFSTFAPIEVPFEVQARRTVYIGRLVIEFPSGLLIAGARLQMQVEDVKQASVDRAEKENGVALSDVVTDLMTVN